MKAFPVPGPPGLTPTYFLALTLDDAAGRTVSRNVYWLSTKQDVLAWDKSEWYVTPVTAYADLTGLQQLPPAEVKASARFESGRARVTIQNPSPAIAFLVHLAVGKGKGGEEVLPVLWDDNYVTLLPGETRELEATFAKAWPFLEVAPKRYTFLFLNGSNARSYEMVLAGPISGNPGPDFWVIGTDGGYLDRPVKVGPTAGKANGKLVMMSGERYMAIVDFAGFQANVIGPNGLPYSGTGCSRTPPRPPSRTARQRSEAQQHRSCSSGLWETLAQIPPSIRPQWAPPCASGPWGEPIPSSCAWSIQPPEHWQQA